MLPETKSAITMHLDDSIAAIPAVATETAMRALREAAAQTLEASLGKLDALLAGLAPVHPEVVRHDRKLQEIRQEMREIHAFVAEIRTDSPESAARYGALLHASDHIERLNRLIAERLGEVKLPDAAERLRAAVLRLSELIRASVAALREGRTASVIPELADFSRQLAEFRKKERAGAFEGTVRGEMQAGDAFQYVRLILLVDGVSYHLWRMMRHLDPSLSAEAPHS
jgi:hypothetical protein